MNLQTTVKELCQDDFNESLDTLVKENIITNEERTLLHAYTSITGTQGYDTLENLLKEANQNKIYEYHRPSSSHDILRKNLACGCLLELYPDERITPLVKELLNTYELEAFIKEKHNVQLTTARSAKDPRDQTGFAFKI
jgi:hypothetical protein